MERLRPDDSKDDLAPVFGCSSIHDMVTSRDEIINEINAWAKYEASGITKLAHYLSRDALAYVELPSVRHEPTLDRDSQSGKQITLYDGSTDFPIFVDLPNPIILKIINTQRNRIGLPTVSKKDLRENFWTADVTLYNIYKRSGTTFNLYDFGQIDIPDMETESVPQQGLIFTPQSM